MSEETMARLYMGRQAISTVGCVSMRVKKNKNYSSDAIEC